MTASYGSTGFLTNVAATHFTEKKVYITLVTVYAIYLFQLFKQFEIEMAKNGTLCLVVSENAYKKPT